MNKFVFVLAISATSLMSAAAHAGGWGGSSGGLLNISPTVDVGNIAALNDIANGNVIGSGNVVTGIIGGNGVGILGSGTGLLGGNKTGIFKSYKLGH